MKVEVKGINYFEIRDPHHYTTGAGRRGENKEEENRGRKGELCF